MLAWVGRGLELVGFIWAHPANQGRRLRAVVRFFAWQASKRVLPRPWDLAVFGGLRLRCYPDSTVASRTLYYGGLPDYPEMTFMMHYLRAADGFLDVGANIGVYTLLAARLVSGTGVVHAVEPGIIASERLRENVDLNELTHVRIHRVAVADRPGAVAFTQIHDAGNRILPNGRVGQEGSRVRAETLDELVGGMRFAMGKMDIEGAEPLALRGAEAMLAAANPPVWQIEFNRIALQRFGCDRPELAFLLAQRGFDLARYHPDERRLEFHPRAWEGRRDVLAVARSRRDEVLERLGA